MTNQPTILDRMIAEAGCHHPNRNLTDHNGDPVCRGCHTEWSELPDQR